MYSYKQKIILINIGTLIYVIINKIVLGNTVSIDEYLEINHIKIRVNTNLKENLVFLLYPTNMICNAWIFLNTFH